MPVIYINLKLSSIIGKHPSIFSMIKERLTYVIKALPHSVLGYAHEVKENSKKY